MERLLRNKYPATEDTYILSHYRPASPCEYNLPTPCPPPVPILVRLKSGPKHLNVHMHHNTTEVYTNSTLTSYTDWQSAHQNSLDGSPAVKATNPIHGDGHDYSFHICQNKLSHDNAYMNTGAKLHHNARPHGSLCKQG